MQAITKIVDKASAMIDNTKPATAIPCFDLDFKPKIENTKPTTDIARPPNEAQLNTNPTIPNTKPKIANTFQGPFGSSTATGAAG